jgi:hypothetical protein
MLGVEISSVAENKFALLITHTFSETVIQCVHKWISGLSAETAARHVN